MPFLGPNNSIKALTRLKPQVTNNNQTLQKNHFNFFESKTMNRCENLLASTSPVSSVCTPQLQQRLSQMV